MHGVSVFDSRYSWIRLAITLLIATVVNVGMWSIISVMPDVQAEFATARATASLPYTLTMAGFALGNLAIGRAVDRFGIRRALVGAAILLGASYAAAAASPSIHVLSAAQFAIGLGTAAGFGPLIADISLWFQRRRGIAVAIAASGNYLAGAVWPSLLQGVQSEGGWRAVYLSLAAIIVASVIPLSLLLGRRIPASATGVPLASIAGSRKAAAFSPRTMQWLLGLAGIGCCIAMSMPQVHIVSLCVDLGFGPSIGAEMLSVMLLGGVASRLISGIAADRLGGMATLLIGSTLQCIALFLYLPNEGLVSLYMVSAIFGLSQGGIVPSYALIVREYMPASEAGTRVGFVMMATIVGMAAGGWMSGWIYDVTGTYRMAFLNGIAWNVLNIAIIIMILSRAGRPRPMAA
ncbi:MFS transporter [Oricola thermophila]|uniref:MFS transporter n=1 Tax=Oricola thermophila TaxID=2742145 RepID=A0A6N1VJU8_9HYPH|nr:MFS transporter [Oricola thermophila]QKV19682.1 MFS transporter [Oricola thermophila]